MNYISYIITIRANYFLVIDFFAPSRSLLDWTESTRLLWRTGLFDHRFVRIVGILSRRWRWSLHCSL